MTDDDLLESRRRALKLLGSGVLAALPAGAVLSSRALAQAPAAPVLMDGHVHITNRIYWEKIDPWARATVLGYARC